MVLVVGASGRLGTAVVRALLAQGKPEYFRDEAEADRQAQDWGFVDPRPKA